MYNSQAYYTQRPKPDVVVGSLAVLPLRTTYKGPAFKIGYIMIMKNAYYCQFSRYFLGI